jgi:carboxypeptidase Q
MNLMRKRTGIGLALLVVLGAAAAAAPAATPAPAPPPATGKAKVGGAAATAAAAAAAGAEKTPLADAYREAAARILAAAARDDGAWAKLSWLTDRIGNRLSGSPSLEKAVRWAADTMLADGHDGVHTEKVMVPHWVRGAAEAEILAPVSRPLRVLALGGSVGTAAKGVTGEVVVAHDFAELAALGEAGVKGKIVLFDHPMPPYGPAGSGYGEAVAYRHSGAARAGKLGALAVLVRSATARSLGSPHTGMMKYDDKGPRVPAAALTLEDTALLVRLAAAGAKPRVRLRLGAKTLPDAESANVVGELRGRERPDEVVVLGAHIDSWDVGAGAHDDGAGCVIVMQALTLLRGLGLAPRRTIRVVLFTNEENGLRGAKAYAEAHKDELARHIAAIEADSGAFAPEGFTAGGGDEDGPPASAPAPADAAAAALAKARATAGLRAAAVVGDAATLLAPLRATKVKPGGGGADVDQLLAAGVPTLGLSVDGSTYFDYHHSDADTLEKVDPAALRACVAAMALMSYVLADMPDPLPRVP